MKKTIVKRPDYISDLVEVEINPILDGIENNIFTGLIKTSMINYVITRLVTLLENYFKTLVQELIDKGGFDPTGILPNDEITISILELEEIKQEPKVSVGAFISHSINFQNIDNINSTMSTLLGGKKFLTRFNDRVSNIDQNRNLRIKKRNFFNWEEFQELFQARHSIIHSIKYDKNISLPKLKRFVFHTRFFLSEARIIPFFEILERMKEGGDITNRTYTKDLAMWNQIEIDAIQDIYS